jgi:hypothetical protein
MGFSALDELDAAELAALALGVDLDELDIDGIDSLLWEKLDVDLNGFIKVVELLMPFTSKHQSPLSGEWFRGFVHDGAFIIKQPVEVSDGQPG